jgi:DNA (cytosine-5)-methyltransferase 1
VGDIGYQCAWRTLDAQYFGVPQRRRRVFVVGYLGDWTRAAAVLFERASLSGHPAPRRETGQIAPTIPSRSTAGGDLGTDFDLDGGVIQEGYGGGNTRGAIDVAACLVAKGQKCDFEVETFIAHSLRGEGFDASEDGTGRGTPLVPVAYRTTGNDGCYETGDIVGALDTQTDPNARIVAFTAKDYGADAMDDCSPTLRAGGFTGSHANGGVMPAVAYDLRGREHGAQFEGPHDTANIRAASGGSSRSYVAASAVRRLTPMECERLQGFLPGYTAVPYRNKPAADGPRYKSLGNSMAVPVMRWIGERIAMVEDLTTLIERQAA